MVFFPAAVVTEGFILKLIELPRIPYYLLGSRIHGAVQVFLRPSQILSALKEPLYIQTEFGMSWILFYKHVR